MSKKTPKILAKGMIDKYATKKFEVRIKSEGGEYFVAGVTRTIKAGIERCNEVAKKLGWKITEPYKKV